MAIALPVLVAGIVAFLAVERRETFLHALGAAPVWLLLSAIALQLVALLARCEAWNLCLGAAGSTVPRRGVFRAAGVGGIGGFVNGYLGVAARIASLRRSAPLETPRAATLLTAEVPILAIEVVLAALASFTLVGPLGLPWWTAPVVMCVASAAVVALGRVAHRRRAGIWAGLAVLRSMSGRWQVFGMILIAVVAQIARNWLALHAIGVDASLFDAVAVLIAMVTLGQLPIGPGVGAAAVVAILGTQGVALTASAGVLLTATGTAGALCFAAWALADHGWHRGGGSRGIGRRLSPGVAP